MKKKSAGIEKVSITWKKKSDDDCISEKEINAINWMFVLKASLINHNDIVGINSHDGSLYLEQFRPAVVHFPRRPETD